MARHTSTHGREHLVKLTTPPRDGEKGGAAAATRRVASIMPGDERLAFRWARRAVTIPAYLCLGFLCVVLLPLSFAVALAIDAGRRTGRLATVRCVLSMTLYLACEAIGLAASFLVWVADRVLPRGDADRFVRWNLVLQQYWARALFYGAARIFTMRTEVSGAEALLPGPVFVFSRHASTLDTLLPAVFVSHPAKLRLRWIMKRELRWDPCLDVVGTRTRNAFVRRASEDPNRELAVIRRLAGDLGDRDGVLIFPEGTRFSEAKRLRAVERLRAGSHPKRVEAAQVLRHVLPPRLRGPLAMLAMRPDVDVIFLVHVGFEGTTNLKDIWGGKLVGRTIRLHFWRVRSAEIPREEAERVQWLDAEWTRIDAWIDAQGGTAA